jgi:uncharacterized protein YjiS (DUF1127 family)
MTRGAGSTLIPNAHPSPARIPFEPAAAAAHHHRMNFVLRLFRAWRAARARNELYGLSDRTLRDIGLRRSDIGSLFR